MTGDDAALAMSVMDKKEIGYFSTHSLAKELADAGIASDPPAVRSLTRRLIEDKEYGQVDAIAAGLRETAGGDDEYARLVSDAAGMVRHDLADGPVVAALVSAGRSDPDAAVAAAERLVELGDADYAAFLVGGAYGGAADRCSAAIESLASSGDPAKIMASLRSLRVAHTEHGSPGAGRVADAVDRALRIDDDEVHCEAMAALLDIYGSDRDRAGPAIRELAMRRHASRPELTACIALDPPFDAAKCAEYLDVCTDGVSVDDRDIVYNTYEALRSLARDRPDDAARLLARLAGRGAYIDTRAGPVLEALGRHHPRKAAEAVLSLLRRPRGANLVAHLSSMVGHAARFADPREVAEPILAALDSEPGMSRRCLAALAALSVECSLGGRGGGDFAPNLLDRVLDHARRAGSAAADAEAQIDASRTDPGAECYNAISAIIHNTPRGIATDPRRHSVVEFQVAEGGAVYAITPTQALPGNPVPLQLVKRPQPR